MKIPKKSPRDPNQLAKLIVDLSTADEPAPKPVSKTRGRAVKKAVPARKKRKT